MTDRNAVLKTIEGRTATLFLVAGGLLVVFAALLGVEAVMDRSAPEDIFGPAGFAFGFVGLLGLYPQLADRSPKLAGAGAVFAALGVVGGAVTSIWHIGEFAGIFPAETPVYVSVFSIGIILGMTLGYLSSGVVILRADVYSRTVGLLLLAVPAVVTVMLVSVITSISSADSAVVLASGQALAHLAIGYTLRTEGVSTDRAEPSVEPTTK